MGTIRFILRNSHQKMYKGCPPLICRNLREINCHDYPPKIIEQLVQEHTPERILRMSTEGKTFLADVAGNPAGILRVLPSWNVSAEYWLRTVFVLPDYHGCGIGRQLVEAGERFIQQQGDFLYVFVLLGQLIYSIKDSATATWRSFPIAKACIQCKNCCKYSHFLPMTSNDNCETSPANCMICN